MEIKYIDLFCGLGAFHTSFKHITSTSISYKCVFACDIDDGVRKLYESNYGIKPLGDINDVVFDDIPDFDILCAGFPCQPFSIAGKKEGFDDETKGNLFFTILNVIDRKNPNNVVLENVKNLLSINDGETFNTIKNELHKRNYHVSYKIIDSKYFNSPQSRQRLFIFATKNKSYVFPLENETNLQPVSSIIDANDVQFINYEEKYYLEECVGRNNENNSKMLYKLMNKTTRKGGRQGERVYSIDHCGITICASSGGIGGKTGLYLVNNKIRRLNVVECLRMFGFADDYIYHDIVKNEDMMFYLGNSIVVNVLDALLKNLEIQFFTNK